MSFLETLGNIFFERDNPNRLSGWEISEIRDHDKTGCDGHDYDYGRWGGLVCKKCGK